MAGTPFVARGLREVSARLERLGHDAIILPGMDTRGQGQMRGVVGHTKHHTVGSYSGPAPSLDVVTFGRAGLRGLLSQIFTSREWQGRKPKCYFCGSGVAWHAGTSSWSGKSGLNFWHIGHEAENLGTPRESWKPSELDLSANVDLILMDVFGFDETDVAEHKEVAVPRGRKVDRHTIVGSQWRARLRKGTPDPIDEEDDLAITSGSAPYHVSLFQGTLNWHIRDKNLKTPEIAIDGKWGSKTTAAWKAVADATPWTKFYPEKVDGEDFQELRHDIDQAAISALRADVVAMRESLADLTDLLRKHVASDHSGGGGGATVVEEFTARITPVDG